MKDLTIIFIVTFCIIFLGACELFEDEKEDTGNNPTISQSIIESDSNGHFLTSLTYYSETGSRTFNTDGTLTDQENLHFEDDGDDYDYDGITGEGWVQFNQEWKGTYTYNSQNLKYTQCWTGYIDESMTEWNEWEYNDTWYSTKVFTSNTWSNAYIKNGTDKWTYNSYSKNSGGIQISNYERSYTINTSSNVYTVEYNDLGGLAYNVNLSVEDNYGTSTIKDFVITGEYPDNTEWKEGNIVTFHIYLDNSRERYFDTSTNLWDDWLDYDYDYTYKDTLANQGNYIFFIGEDSNRDIKSNIEYDTPPLPVK